MAGVDDLDPKKDVVKDPGETDHAPNADDSSDAVGSSSPADAAKSSADNAGSLDATVSSDAVSTSPDTAQAQPASFSPAPIPILDRPPAGPQSSLADVDVNSIYAEDAPVTSAETNDGSQDSEVAASAANTTSESDIDATMIRPLPAVEQTTQSAPTTPADPVVPVTPTAPVAPVTPPARTSFKTPPAQPASADDANENQPNGVQKIAVFADVPSASASVTGVNGSPADDVSETGNSLGSGNGSESGTGSRAGSGEPPFSDFEEEKQGRGMMKGLIGAAVAVVVLGGGYAAAQYAYADQIAKDVTVAGVNIGGLTEPEAAKLLDAELTPKLKDDLELKAGDLQTSIVPAKSGISFDAEATVADLTGFSWQPMRLIEHLTGGNPIEPELTVSQEEFGAAIGTVEASLYVEPVDGTVSFIDGEAIATAAENGVGIDVEAAKTVIVSNLFSGTRPVALSPTEIEPEITQAVTDEALATAKKIASAAVVVEVSDQKAEIPQAAFTEDINISFENGTADFTFDGKKLSKDVVKRTDDLLTVSEDAKFVFEGGKPKIKSGKPGTSLDPKALAAAFKTAALSDERVAKVELVETDPEESIAKLEALGITELVTKFSTPITNEVIRTKNLQVAAERITGYLVKPGEEFNLMNVIGPVTTANGYYSAGVIVNGVHTEGVGGGLSQVSTTTYNAGFFAGMTDIAHRPHSVWFTRYPEGRESTLFAGSIDMIWRNDSKTGILLRSYVAGGQFTVEAWGTKTYKVETTTSPRRNVTPAKMTTSTAANCSYYPVGHPGFTVTVTRKVTELESSKMVIDEANTWTYRPDNGVTCKKQETKKSSKDD